MNKKFNKNRKIKIKIKTRIKNKNKMEKKRRKKMMKIIGTEEKIIKFKVICYIFLVIDFNGQY